MSQLHILNKSPFHTRTLESCLAHLGEGSSILLIEDGIYAAMRGTPIEAKISGALGKTPVYALGPDLDARGMTHDKVVSGVKIVDYAGFVDLAAQHDSVNSWL